MLGDLRYAVRMLASHRGFTTVAVSTLTLGIGATTALFSVVNGVLLRPLPFPEADRLCEVMATTPESGAAGVPVSPLNFRDWRERNRSFESLIGVFRDNFNLSGGGSPERLRGAWVSAGFFELLRVEPALGRAFLAEEDGPGGSQVAVISHGLWRRRFGAMPGIIGAALDLDGRRHTVVGVAPRGFELPGDADVWVPLGLDYSEDRGSGMLVVLARLRPGISMGQASADMDRIAAQLEKEFPDSNTGTGVVLASLKETFVADVRPALLVLLGAVTLVLLIAAANVGNLLLTRARARQREVAIRQALGAGRSQLLRQFVTESLLLTLVAGGLGVLLAVWGTHWLVVLFGSHIPRSAEIGVDVRVLLFTLLLSCSVGLLLGLVPALQASRDRIAGGLRDNDRSHAGRYKGSQQLLVISEVGLAVVLLVGAALLIRSFANLIEVDPGFSGRDLLTMELNLNGQPYAADAARQIAFLRETLERVEALPGVVSAGTTYPLPLFGRRITAAFVIEGRPRPGVDRDYAAELRFTSPGYFETMGVPLLEGRYLSDGDTRGAMPAVVVSRSFAERFFPGEPALGQRIALGSGADPERAPWTTVVGVVSDVRHIEIADAGGPEMYVSSFQSPFQWNTLVVRAAGDPRDLVGPVRGAIQAADPDLPAFNVKTVDEIVAASLGRPRFTTTLLGLFSGLALALAGIGIYGVLSYSVTRRAREIGIRLALGASVREVMSMVMRQGMTPPLLGLAAGVVGALGLTRLLASLLYGVGPLDPTTFLSVALLLLLVALVASYAPARRATRVSPMEILRSE